MKKSVHCVVVALLVMAISVRAQQTASINLAKPSESAEDAETQKTNQAPHGCQKLLPGIFADGVVVPEQGHPRPEILVEISRVSDPMPTIGSESQIGVRLRNSGKEPIHIPWSVDANTIQTGQAPNHLRWDVGYFTVRLNGSALANRTLTQRLYSSEFSKGSQLMAQPGEWITATIKFKFEYALFPNRRLEPGEARLSVEWEQYARSWDVNECKVASGSYYYDYTQFNPAVPIQLRSAIPNEGQNGKE